MASTSQLLATSRTGGLAAPTRLPTARRHTSRAAPTPRRPARILAFKTDDDTTTTTRTRSPYQTNGSSPYSGDAHQETYAQKLARDPQAAVDDLWGRIERIENKPLVAAYTGGGVLALWVGISVLRGLNSVPLLPQFLELVGVTYTAWFFYRYVLFHEGRQELRREVAEFRQKVSNEVHELTEQGRELTDNVKGLGRDVDNQLSHAVEEGKHNARHFGRKVDNQVSQAVEDGQQSARDLNRKIDNKWQEAKQDGRDIASEVKGTARDVSRETNKKW
jgi:uncharacterized protein YoxC